MADNCINGRWNEGTCVCRQGYDVGFDEHALNPRYCENELVAVVDLSNTLTSSGALLHFMAMTITIVLLAWGIMGVCSVYASIVSLYKLQRRTTKVEYLREGFNVKQSEYSDTELKNATLWEPPEEKFKQFKTA